MRAMLDQLMGKDRDVPLDQRVMRRANFSDPEVCKHALAGLCPFGLFSNTKSDLGPCEFELHEDHLDWDETYGEYEALNERERDRLGYERSLLRLLQRLVSDMDRKIEKAEERARLESMPKPLKPDQQREVDGLRQQAKDLTSRSEKMAEEGDVDASMAALGQVERLREEASKLEARYSAPDRYMEVCDVCGVFIQSTDNEARRRDHLEGKQYLGWLAIREKHKELQSKYAGGGHPPVGGAYPPVAPPREPEKPEEGEVQEEGPGGSREPEGRQGERSRSQRRSRSRSRERRRPDERDRRYDDRRHDERDSRGYDRGYGRGRGYDDRGGYDRRDSRGYDDRRGYNAMPPPRH